MEEEVEVSVDEAVEYLLDRVAILEAAFGELLEAFNELNIDHQALYMLMRNTGKFSKEVFRKYRAVLVKDQAVEETEEVLEEVSEDDE